MTQKPDNPDKHLKSRFTEVLKIAGLAVAIGFVVRSLLFQPFYIPSESMEPNLKKGDYIIASKYAYGYGKYALTPFTLPIQHKRIFEREPKRGDVIVFRTEDDPSFYVKRLVGMPGDEIQMRSGYIYINGEQQAMQKLAESAQVHENGSFFKEQRYMEMFSSSKNVHVVLDTIKGARTDTTGIYHVPEDSYFFMGDNRDQSLDSRYPVVSGGIGFVPKENLVGKVEFILVSVGDNFNFFKPWTWCGVRGGRLLRGLK